MNTIVEFPGVTRLDLDPQKILDAAPGEDMESVIIVGWKNDGEMYLASSAGNVLEVVATLDIAKASLVNDMVDNG